MKTPSAGSSQLALAMGCVLLGACSTTGKVSQGAAGLATASAILVAVPLAPVVKLYDVLNDTEGKDQARFDAWLARVGPLYTARAAAIRQRDAVADARAARAAGPVGYLSLFGDSGLYPGVQAKPVDWRQNNRIVLQNAVLAPIHALVQGLPEDSESDGNLYYLSPQALPYKDFDEARDDYRVAFNQALEAGAP